MPGLPGERADREEGRLAFGLPLLCAGEEMGTKGHKQIQIKLYFLPCCCFLSIHLGMKHAELSNHSNHS